MTAPERIYMDGDIEVGEGYWTRCFETEKPCNEPALEYVRADLIPAMIAEADARGAAREREAIAQSCDELEHDAEERDWRSGVNQMRRLAAAIRARGDK